MGIVNVPHRTFTVPDSAATGQDRPELAISYDLSTEAGCRAYARELVVRAVMATQMETRTKEAAIYSLERRYKLGSFIRKLWKDQPVVIRADRLVRLERAHSDAIRALKGRL